ncbi:MAG TPA: hypothetical protein VI636_25630 [Candidatus Angelobacter sp.]
MPHLAGNYDEGQEFWKPAVPLRQEAPQPGAEVQVCNRCGADFLAAARFCHVCGAERTASLAGQKSIGTRAWMAVVASRDAMGHTNASLIALFLGVACIVAAVVTGFMYTATTILDWQAVQIWRIEWLLAGLAMFAGGILLKKR